MEFYEDVDCIFPYGLATGMDLCLIDMELEVLAGDSDLTGLARRRFLLNFSTTLFR